MPVRPLRKYAKIIDLFSIVNNKQPFKIPSFKSVKAP